MYRYLIVVLLAALLGAACSSTDQQRVTPPPPRSFVQAHRSAFESLRIAEQALNTYEDAGTSHTTPIPQEVAKAVRVLLEASKYLPRPQEAEK